MAYDLYLGEQIERIFKEKKLQCYTKKMMGGLIFMVNDKMCVGLDIDKKTNQNRLMVRVGKLNYENLLNHPDSRLMDFTGKPMRGFLFIDPRGFDTDENLEFWIDKALEFNAML